MSATITERLKLILHEGIEFFNIKHFNDNFQKIEDNVLIKSDIVNNTDTDDTTKVLSAATGKTINEKIDSLSNNSFKQSGTVTCDGVISDYFRYKDITFQTPFIELPDININVVYDSSTADGVATIYNVKESGFRIVVQYVNGSAGNKALRNVKWSATGPIDKQ